METADIQEAIGELLAAGRTDEDIISMLVEEEQLSNEDATTALREVYEGWQNTRELLDLNDNNLKDWHIFLRKHILKSAIVESTVASLRLALSVLDSLATIQGISTTEGQNVPLSITLVEKKEESEEAKQEVSDDAESSNVNGHD